MIHWRPGGDEYIGDMIPFFWDGEYHIFYLKRCGRAPYPWCHIKSSDLLHWQTLPDVVHPGPPGAPDAAGCWTGSIAHHDGTFYCFYTGWNPDADNLQTICVATSRDLETWEKADDNPVLIPDPRWYEARDWRDPYVFYNPEEEQWWMVICARDAGAPGPRRGALALATSPDLQTWQVQEPLWSGGVCYAPECPDVFKLGDRWYLVYSHGITRYRHAASSSGPWLAAAPDTLDSHQVCAAKSLSDGQRRLLFGWVPTKEGDSDGGARQWGGHMAIPRLLAAQPDGALLPDIPTEFAAIAEGGEAVDPATAEPLRGSWALTGEAARVTSADGVALLRLDVPADFILSAELQLAGDACEAGFLVRMTDSGDAGRKVAIERPTGRLAVYNWQTWGDPEAEMARPLRLGEAEPVRVHIVCHGSILEAFVGGRASLAARLYNPRDGWLGLWVANGSAAFRHLRLAPLDPLM